MTANNIRTAYCVNMSNQRITDYMIKYPPSYIIADEGLQAIITRKYLTDMFLELSAYCKLSNKPAESKRLVF